MEAENAGPTPTTVLGWLAFLVATELVLVAFLIPEATLNRLWEVEHQRAMAWVGEEAVTSMDETARSWYRAVVIDSGLQAGLHDLLIDRWKEQGELAVDDRGFGDWFAGRLNALWLAVAIALYRVAVVAVWFPPLIPVIAAVAWDAWFQRRIYQHRFRHPSPALYTAARWKFIILAGILMLTPLLPIPLPGFWVPLGVLLVAIMGWIGFVNLRKRI